jgi:hypothetical protein
MIRGGRKSSSGRIPSGAPLGLAPGTRHIEGDGGGADGVRGDAEKKTKESQGEREEVVPRQGQDARRALGVGE